MGAGGVRAAAGRPADSRGLLGAFGGSASWRLGGAAAALSPVAAVLAAVWLLLWLGLRGDIWFHRYAPAPRVLYGLADPLRWAAAVSGEAMVAVLAACAAVLWLAMRSGPLRRGWFAGYFMAVLVCGWFAHVEELAMIAAAVSGWPMLAFLVKPRALGLVHGTRRRCVAFMWFVGVYALADLTAPADTWTSWAGRCVGGLVAGPVCVADGVEGYVVRIALFVVAVGCCWLLQLRDDAAAAVLSLAASPIYWYHLAFPAVLLCRRFEGPVVGRGQAVLAGAGGSGHRRKEPDRVCGPQHHDHGCGD